MNMFKRYDPARDLFMLILLLLLIKPALYLGGKSQQSDAAQKEQFCSHELDKEIVNSFETAKRQLEQTITLAEQKNRHQEAVELEDLLSSLTTIKTRYEKNSPGLLFLGPFSAISIVLKELEIEKELQEIAAQLNEYLRKNSSKKQVVVSNDRTLDVYLQENQLLVKEFSISTPQLA